MSAGKVPGQRANRRTGLATQPSLHEYAAFLAGWAEVGLRCDFHAAESWVNFGRGVLGKKVRVKPRRPDLSGSYLDAYFTPFLSPLSLSLSVLPSFIPSSLPFFFFCKTSKTSCFVHCSIFFPFFFPLQNQVLHQGFPYPVWDGSKHLQTTFQRDLPLALLAFDVLFIVTVFVEAARKQCFGFSCRPVSQWYRLRSDRVIHTEALCPQRQRIHIRPSEKSRIRFRKRTEIS